MAAPVIQVKKLPMAPRRKRAAYTPLISPQAAQERYTLAKAAEDKGFQLTDLTDFAKEAGQTVLGAALDTAALPQRELFSLTEGNGLVNPYSAEAEKYDPSKVLKLKGTAGLAADIFADPLIVGGGVKAAGNVAFQTAKKGLLTLGPKAVRQGMKAGEKQAAEQLAKVEAEITPEARLSKLEADKQQRDEQLQGLLDQQSERNAIATRERQTLKDTNAAVGRQGKGQIIDGSRIGADEIAAANIKDKNFVPDDVSITPEAQRQTLINLTEKEIVDLGHQKDYVEKKLKEADQDVEKAVDPLAADAKESAKQTTAAEQLAETNLRGQNTPGLVVKRVKQEDGSFANEVQPGTVQVPRQDIRLAAEELDRMPLGLAEAQRLGGTGEVRFDTLGVQKAIQSGLMRTRIEELAKQSDELKKTAGDSSAGKAADAEYRAAQSEADNLSGKETTTAEAAGRQFGRSSALEDRKMRTVYKKNRSWRQWNNDYNALDRAVGDIAQKIIIGRKNLESAIASRDALLADKASKELEVLVGQADEAIASVKSLAEQPTSFGLINAAGKARKARNQIDDLINGKVNELRGYLDDLEKQQLVTKGRRTEAAQGRTGVEKTLDTRIELGNRLFPRGRSGVQRGNDPSPGRWKGNSVEDMRQALTLDAENKVNAASRTYETAKQQWDEAINAVNAAESSGSRQAIEDAAKALEDATNRLYDAEDTLAAQEKLLDDALTEAGRITDPMSASEKLSARKFRGSTKRSADALQKREADRMYAARRAQEARRNARRASRRASSVKTQETIQRLKSLRAQNRVDQEIDKLITKHAAINGVTPETKIGGKFTKGQMAGSEKRARKAINKYIRKGRSLTRLRESLVRQIDDLTRQRDELVREQKASKGKPVVPTSRVTMRSASETWFKEGRKLEDKVVKTQTKIDDIQNQIDYLKTPEGELAWANKEGISSLIGGELAPDNVALILGWRKPFTSGQMVPLVAIQNENIARLMKSLGKVPLVGRLGKALNEAFNPAANSDRRFYEARRLTSHSAVELTEQEIKYLLRFWQDVTPLDRQLMDNLGRVEHDVLDLDVLKPDTWGDVVTEYRTQAAATRASLAKQLDSGSITYKKYEKGLLGAALDDELADRAEEGIKLWSQLSDAAKETHLVTHRTYQRKGRELVALGILKESDLRANYQYSKSLTSDDLRARNRSSAPPVTEKEFMKSKKLKGLPDDFTEMDSLFAYIRDSNAIIANRAFIEQTAFKFGLTQKASKAAAKETGTEYVKWDAANKIFDYPIYIPKQIEESINNLVNIGTDPTANSEFMKIIQDLSSKWKSAAYTVNFGHLLADATGDVYNTALYMGPADFAKYSARVLTAGHGLAKVELYLQSIAEGKGFDDVIEVGGKNMTLRELSSEEIKFGSKKNVSVSVRRLATSLRARGLVNSGAAVNDVGGTVLTPKGALFNKRLIGDKNVPQPRPVKAVTTGSQQIGNWRDNFFKHRMALAMHLERRADEGLGSFEALRQASKDVRISLFDYSELTQFEKRIARNFIPFYTWTRKNVPYQVRQLLERPVAATVPFKLQEGLRDPNEPDYLTPDYVRERYLRIGKLPKPLAKLLGQKPNQPFYLNPMLPSYDLGFLQKTTGGIDTTEPLGMLSPYVRLPLELAAEKPTNFQTGAPIDGEYFGNNRGVPILGAKGEYILSNILGQPGRQFVRGVDAGRPQSERVLPFLGAQLGVRGTLVDPAKQLSIAERKVDDKRREEIRLLQEAGLLPSGDALAAARKSRKLSGLSVSLTPKY